MDYLNVGNFVGSRVNCIIWVKGQGQPINRVKSLKHGTK